MKRLMLTLSSLVLVNAACGGRVNLRDGLDDSEGSGTEPSSGGRSTSSGGAGTSIGAKSTGGKAGGSNPGMMPAGKGGAASIPEPTEGGAPIDGPFVIGGDTGSGGGSGGATPDTKSACAQFCRAYSVTCPLAGFGEVDTCTSKCVSSLALDNDACNAGKRAAYACIADAFSQAPDDCNQALALATKQCGAATPQVSACNARCIADSLYGGGPDGCHATAECNGVTLDLNCQDDAGGVPCSCSVDGKKIWELATGFEYSKAGCLDEDLFRLCAKELP